MSPKREGDVYKQSGRRGDWLQAMCTTVWGYGAAYCVSHPARSPFCLALIFPFPFWSFLYPIRVEVQRCPAYPTSTASKAKPFMSSVAGGRGPHFAPSKPPCLPLSPFRMVHGVSSTGTNLIAKPHSSESQASSRIKSLSQYPIRMLFFPGFYSHSQGDAHMSQRVLCCLIWQLIEATHPTPFHNPEGTH